MTHAEYQREWRKNNPEKAREQQERANEKRRGKPRKTRRKNPDQRCIFCDIKMASKFGSRTRRFVCDSCAESKSLSRKRNAEYCKRYYHRRKLPTAESNLCK